MESYSSYNDDELISRLRDGDDSITDYILDKYKPLVRKKAGFMNILGADRDDLIQEGMIGLYKAVRDYDLGRDASFVTFAELCISRQMYTAVKNSQRKKHLPLNDYVSFEHSISAGEEPGDKDGGMLNILIASKDMEPEARLIDKESQEKLWQLMAETLSQFEYSVMELHMTGMSTAEVARVLGRDNKSTDNALQRARGKMKKKMDEQKQ